MSAPGFRVGAPAVSILIKALNEERHIAQCLAAAVNEARLVGGEVVLVDSCSTDRTLDIARGFPVRVVQFQNIEDRGCAAGVQLGFQSSAAPFLYILDADMVLQPGFLQLALARMHADAGLAGIGGKLIDVKARTATDERRINEYQALTQEAAVQSLGGGGLYRRSAVEGVGYLAHRWLPANEEAELGVRLRTAGWRLVRLPEVAVTHDGHSESNWAMMRRLWRSGRFRSSGMFVRSAIGKAWFGATLNLQRHVFYAPALHLLICAGAWLLAMPLGLPAATLAAMAWMLVWGGMAVRTGSMQSALWSITAWHTFALGFAIGMLHSVGSPYEQIESVLLQEPCPASRDVLASESR